MPALAVTPIGAARERLLSTALDLFVYHGVNGTSLELMADALGVPSASIRHQFPTKADLVLAVITPILDDLTHVAEVAEAQRSVTSRREVALSGLVDVVVENRRLAAVLHADPVVSRLVREYPPMLTLTRRLNPLLTGPDEDPHTLVAVAVVGGGLMMVGMDPQLAELDDATLHRLLLRSARRTLRLRTPSRRRL